MKLSIKILKPKNMDPLFDFKDLTDFKSLIIKLASPEDIRKWSHGEVTKPETINYRTLKPEKDGLFDERIFGPTKDWECYCGKYKRIRYKGVVCDKCGVEVTLSRVRRERMGHINLVCPVAHVWYFKGAPSKVSLVLDIAPRSIEQIIYFARHLVLKLDEKGKKEAIENLEKARKESILRFDEDYQEKKKALNKSASEDKDKIDKKIKNKEQASLAKLEIDLELRKREQLLSDEHRLNVEKTNQLFDNLTTLVKSLRVFSVLSEDELDQLSSYHADGFFEAKTGAEAILTALESVNLEELSSSLRKEMSEAKENTSRFVKLAKRLKLIDGMRRSKINPAWMILRVLPVLPPDLRPMVQLSGGRFATSDLNDLYRRVINRNNRLKHLINLGAPEIILRNEKRMLQEAVDSLIDASQKKATRRGRGKQPLRSLSDMLKGKQGRFRQNLLGKRVDYSGRSVIVVGPDLRLNECGLPKDMALEMFKPFVLREMIKRGIAPNVKSAKNMLERKPDEVFDILEEITKNHPVLLNRAPTLHKLSILAFYPVLIEGSAIRLHPAVCNGFNADFDGDQMAVHVPLSQKAIDEAKNLMMPQHNLLKPSDGTPIAIPSRKEMALGIYYITDIDERIPASTRIFADKNEAISFYHLGQINIRQQIKVRINNELVQTTVGRIFFNEALPEGFGFVNEAVTSSTIKSIFNRIFMEYGNQVVVEVIDKMKDLGFWGGSLSGISMSIFDAAVSPDKEKMIKEAEKEVSNIEQNFAQGLITAEEKKRMVEGVWIETSEKLADMTWDLMDKYNPIRVVIDAKVGRASRDQVKQLAAMRGLITDPLGKTVELPIKSNFREGLSVFEYVTSSRGSRKGLTDTALKTADAGYLTRRLVDVTHDVLVRADDCGTKEGLKVNLKDQKKENAIFKIIGRVLASDVVNPKTKKVEVAQGELIDEVKAEKIVELGISELEVFSPLTCKLSHGVCAKCYGWDLSTKKLVEVGTPVGIIAAQSIGEPGTQLTLRTKHSAGVVGVDVTQGLPRVEELFEARTPKVTAPLSEISGKVSVSEADGGWKISVSSSSSGIKDRREYIIPKTLTLTVKDGDRIEVGAPLAIAPLDLREIMAVKGLRFAQEYIISQVQKVYESQGIPIHDKHFEIIVRKMSDKVKIVTCGDTSLLPGDLVDRSTFESENEKVLASGGEPASAQQVILGITRRALYTESWLSSASFEQTTEVLTESALEGKEDKLLGLKENVIIGRLIPVSPEAARLPDGGKI
jgi:DNA-directed RNA polymerase subunit beta'